MTDFSISSDFQPCGDQPAAIAALSAGLRAGKPGQVLLGVTGSGKTFTMAHVIATVNRPTLVIAPNKTLAAQLYSEFRGLFPENAVEYFVSYYDYYQPEAYIPASDTYIQKDSSINEMIDKLRHSATMSVLTRRDVIVVASVSCIFGLGSPEDYLSMRVQIRMNQEYRRQQLLRDLVAMHYERNDIDFYRGTFRVRGDRVEIFPAYEEDEAVRIDFFGDEIDGISIIDPLRGEIRRRLKKVSIFPASHYVTARRTLKRACETITRELRERIRFLRDQDRLIEAQRIEERTGFDLEMIRELGYCNGIENYSRHLTGRKPGEPPPTLLDYFPDDFLVFIDESHIAVPQLRAMYRGDRSRKETLVKYGFRLPSALDNRPLKFEETEQRLRQVVFVSATPGDYELQRCRQAVVEQIVRPTGLVDPMLEVRSAVNQVDDLLEEIRLRMQRSERILVTTLTKRMAEDLTEYYTDLGIEVRYLHSDIKTLDRMEIISELRRGSFDVLVGINLLREGLDIPEVSLVAVLDADKEGFLRSTRSLIQTFGRASRNVRGKVIMYAEKITDSMRRAIDETERRRLIQAGFNTDHGIIPASVVKEISSVFEFGRTATAERGKDQVAETAMPFGDVDEAGDVIRQLQQEMLEAAKQLDFERAARLRDRIKILEKKVLFEA
jgi:excinuclease ABC subunit B